VNFKTLDKIIMGIIPDDVIGLIIIEQDKRVLNLLLDSATKSGVY